MLSYLNSIFRQQADSSCPSTDSSCSALPHKHTLTQVNNKTRVLNTYSSLPRPGHSPLVGWRYADQSELVKRVETQGGPEYANLTPWTQSRAPPPTPPRAVHYATLGRAPMSRSRISKVRTVKEYFLIIILPF